MSFLLWSGWVGLLLMSCQTPLAEVHRPNILLIMCDDLGWGDVAFNGNTRIQTPNLDRLAAEGLILSRFYAAAPVCSPTRASCITGRHPFRMGIFTANIGHLRSQEITLPEILAEQSYATGHFGKWHLGTLTTRIRDANRGRPGDSTHYAIPSQHGYQEYFCTESKVPTWDPLIKPTQFNTARGESLRYGWAAIEDSSQATESYGTYYWSGPEQIALHNVSGDNSRVIMDRVIPFVESALGEKKPFFATVWFHTPHLPVVSSKAYRARYPDLSHREQIYAGSITAMDEQVGRLWDYLEETGQAEHTMLWFCSDNGPERDTPGTAGPFRERKRSLYEGGVRVPAFCNWPGHLDGGKRIELPMVTSDYLPTLLDYLNIPYPKSGRTLDGISLKPFLEGKQDRRNAPIGFQHRDRMSWVTERFKLISTDQGESFELYDLLADPGEKKNIAMQHPDVVKQMRTDLRKWIEACKRSEKGLDY